MLRIIFLLIYYKSFLLVCWYMNWILFFRKFLDFAHYELPEVILASPALQALQSQDHASIKLKELKVSIQKLPSKCLPSNLQSHYPQKSSPPNSVKNSSPQAAKISSPKQASASISRTLIRSNYSVKLAHPQGCRHKICDHDRLKRGKGTEISPVQQIHTQKYELKFDSHKYCIQW